MWLKQLLLFVLYAHIAYSEPISNCLNGGVPGNDEESPCVCLPYWTGDTCDKAQCVNGGYTDDSSRYCICPTGYFGLHCEAATKVTPPLNSFKAKANTLNLIYYNLFSDYYGKNAYQLFTKAVNNHYQKYSSYYTGGVNVYATSDESDDGNKYPMNCDHTTNDCDYGDKFMTLKSYLTAPPFPEAQYPISYWCYYVPMYRYILELIKDRKLEDTAITILTQHPPVLDDSYDELIQTALSFHIRINVLFSDDQTFIRCSSDQIDLLRQLSDRTGGIFTDVPSDALYDETNTIINTILATSVSYEDIDFGVGLQGISFKTDPIESDYYVLLSNGIVSDRSKCVRLANGAVSDSFAVYRLLGPMPDACSLKFAPASQEKMVVKIFTAGSDKKVMRPIYSFVEDATKDTSEIMPYNEVQYNLALRLNIDPSKISSSVTVSASFVDHQSGSSITLGDGTSRQGYSLDSYFNSGFTCLTGSSNDAFGIRLTISNASLPTQFSRYIPVYCLTLPPSTTVAMDLSTTQQQTTAQSTVASTVASTAESTAESTAGSTAESTAGSTAESTVSPTVPPPPADKTYVLGYTNTVDESSYETFLLTSTDKSIGSLTQHYSNFGEVLFQSKANKGYQSQNNYESFIQAIYNDQKKTAADADPTQTQILESLLSIINSENKTSQNSLISFLTDVLPDEQGPFLDEDITKYKDLINKNNKVLFWMDSNDFDVQRTRFGRHADMLNLLASLTNGHFVVSNHSSPDFTDCLTNFYAKGPAQNLIFSKNFMNTNPEQIIGTADFSKVSKNITIYGTATFQVQDLSDILFSPFSLKFKSQTSNIIQTVMFNYTSGSNLFTADFSLYPDQYTISGSFVVGKPKSISVRLWNSDSMYYDIDVNYVDYDDKVLKSPDNYFGAALRAELQGDKTSPLSVTFSDCRSKVLQTSYLDAQQNVNAVNKIFHFVPLFCQKRDVAENCVPGTERMYNMQLSTADGSFVGTKSFYCDNSVTQPECAFIDNAGNRFCDTPISPFLRGPAKMLLDCSGNGKLMWTESKDPLLANYAPYNCVCDDDAKGLSCEIGLCSDTAQPGSIDTQYRTYTVVIGFLSDFTLAKQVFVDAENVVSVDETTENIWLYQLYMYCSDGTYYVIYSGKSPSDFNAALKNPTVGCVLNPDPTEILDVTDVFRVATSSIGKDQNGIITLFFETETPLNKASINRTDFDGIAQQYRQKLFIYNALEESGEKVDLVSKRDLIQATISTGGSTIIDDLLLDNGQPPFTIFKELLKSRTSLNYHTYNEKQISNMNTNIESNSAYLIVGGDASQSPLNVNKGQTYDIFTKIVKMTNQDVITFAAANPASWASVIVLDGVTLPYAVLKDRKISDSWTAVSVNEADSRTVLGLRTPPGYTLVNSLYPQSRTVLRSTCVFDTIVYQPINPLPLGYSQFEIVLKPATGNQFSKVFPIITSSSSDCQNDAKSQKSGVCECGSTFTGPDCSRLLCGDHGKPSTWGKACNCDGTVGGKYCNMQANNFFAYF